MNSRWSILLLLLSGCGITPPIPSGQPTEDFMVAGFPRLPRDARAIVERLAACNHFAGEITGGASRERDAEVYAAMTRLGCATIETEAATIRAKYKTDSAVQAALTQAAGF